MKVLIACEESQRVCIEFRKRGHEAYSADIQEPSGGHPEWHILGDVLKILRGGCFITMDETPHYIHRWDMIIAHPPCTYLTSVATRHHSLKCTPLEKINDRTLKRIDAMQFFMQFVNAPCDRIAIENPKGIMNTAYRAADQTIDPYMFAESEQDTENYVTKATCLWLKGLPKLQTKYIKQHGEFCLLDSIEKPDNEKLYGRNPSGNISCWEERGVSRGKDCAKERSKTFSAVAKAFAEQWG